MDAPRPHNLWHSRGYLPHFDFPGVLQSISFRLYDSVPRESIARWMLELGICRSSKLPSDDPRAVELRDRIRRFEDAGHGACWLRQAPVARCVEGALLHFDGERYRLLAWCVMPNHVHALIETRNGHPVSEVLQSWKSFTSKRANALLGRTGKFWEPDYFDRFVRDAEHLRNTIRYIEANPVKAGLAMEASQWPWSSASDAGRRPALPGVRRERSALPGGSVS